MLPVINIYLHGERALARDTDSSQMHVNFYRPLLPTPLPGAGDTHLVTKIGTNGADLKPIIKAHMHRSHTYALCEHNCEHN